MSECSCLRFFVDSDTRTGERVCSDVRLSQYPAGPAAFNAAEPEKRGLNFPFNILVRELPSSSSSGRGRFALGEGFGSVDGPGFDAEAGRGGLSVGFGVGGRDSPVDG